jgi:hypothetical protein
MSGFIEALSAHELDVGVRQKADLKMPLSGMGVSRHAMVQQKPRANCGS